MPEILTPAEKEVLDHLDELADGESGKTVREIAASAEQAGGAIRQGAESLRRDGLVQRRGDPYRYRLAPGVDASEFIGRPKPKIPDRYAAIVSGMQDDDASGSDEDRAVWERERLGE